MELQLTSDPQPVRTCVPVSVSDIVTWQLLTSTRPPLTFSSCLALQDRLEKVEKEVQSLKGENLALKLVLEEKKTFASVVKDGEVEVDSWKVVAASATKCTLKRHSAVDLNNRFSTLSDECEEGASNTTSATPSVSVERGSSADVMTSSILSVVHRAVALLMPHKFTPYCGSERLDA
ncbi:hypothetical protein Hamer_G013616 [Homarus americanus]|uniref:Uncharacterized protein n=1 Tax=Homarus americanus TaxID=6706 RepID=A0A8J5K333_HOMAM|nr:hypothetical protein Hamer_G013616 [Homarus americanus]